MYLAPTAPSTVRWSHDMVTYLISQRVPIRGRGMQNLHDLIDRISLFGSLVWNEDIGGCSDGQDTRLRGINLLLI